MVSDFNKGKMLIGIILDNFNYNLNITTRNFGRTTLVFQYSHLIIDMFKVCFNISIGYSVFLAIISGTFLG